MGPLSRFPDHTPIMPSSSCPPVEGVWSGAEGGLRSGPPTGAAPQPRRVPGHGHLHQGQPGGGGTQASFFFQDRPLRVIICGFFLKCFVSSLQSFIAPSFYPAPHERAFRHIHFHSAPSALRCPLWSAERPVAPGPRHHAAAVPHRVGPVRWHRGGHRGRRACRLPGRPSPCPPPHPLPWPPPDDCHV